MTGTASIPFLVHDPLQFFRWIQLKRRRISAGITVRPLAVIVLLILSPRMNYIFGIVIIQFAAKIKKNQSRKGKCSELRFVDPGILLKQLFYAAPVQGMVHASEYWNTSGLPWGNGSCQRGCVRVHPWPVGCSIILENHTHSHAGCPLVYRIPSVQQAHMSP